MTPQIYLTVGLAIAAWAISGIVTVTYMKAQSAVTMAFMEAKLKEIDRHLESVDGKHEQLLRDFNDHRVQNVKEIHDAITRIKREN
jgi:hypothetical protein